MKLKEESQTKHQYHHPLRRVRGGPILYVPSTLTGRGPLRPSTPQISLRGRLDGVSEVTTSRVCTTQRGTRRGRTRLQTGRSSGVRLKSKGDLGKEIGWLVESPGGQNGLVSHRYLLDVPVEHVRRSDVVLLCLCKCLF